VNSEPLNIPDELQKVIDFHGHICPGLIIGYRAAKMAAKHLGLDRDVDEEVVAVVENDACGVDAIQCVLGCTVGKGNLIFRDQGKNAYAIFRRDTNQALRLVFKTQTVVSSPEEMAVRKRVMEGSATPDEKAKFEEKKTERMIHLLGASDEELFDCKKPSFAIPERARIFDSYSCESCGETTMEPRLRLVGGKKVCLDCAEPYQRGW
jgi:formylmethanofuran dehydrogenase subunit E